MTRPLRSVRLLVHGGEYLDYKEAEIIHDRRVPRINREEKRLRQGSHVYL